MFIKINQLIDSQGRADYKGLDINHIVAGTQVYPPDENVAYFEYDGASVTHPDIKVLTSDEYHAIVKTENERPRPLTPDELQRQEIETLKKQQALMQAAIDDMLMMGGGL